MLKTIFIFVFCFFYLNLFGQKEEFSASKISDCVGATNIIEPGVFTVQFTGNGGTINETLNYPSLSDINENNSIWFSFIAPFSGVVKFEASIISGPLQMVIFEEGVSDICDEIHNGRADIKRLITSTTISSLGLNNNPDANQLYSLELKEGQKICMLFNTDSRSREKLKLDFKFESLNSNLINNSSKIIDLREDEFTPSIHIVIRDASTGLPVITNMTLLGIKNLSALYIGSDFYFSSDKTGKFIISCDTKGYFFVDRVEHIVANKESEFAIWLEPLAQGKSLQLEEIEFHPGSSNFMPTAEPKLKRLKDFLALNSEVKIEIQGHVFSMDENNSFVGQKLSEARAKRVYNYLVEFGINKDRMTTVGFGNTKPIYSKPKFAYEEQMNRRVEIKVL